MRDVPSTQFYVSSAPVNEVSPTTIVTVFFKQNRNMRNRHILLTLLMIMAFSFYGHGQADEPDFAYPATVAGDARLRLQYADDMDADSASKVRLRALLELAVAITSTDPDSVYTLPAQIKAEAAKKNNSASGRAMLTMLQASVLNRIYQRRSWRYDQVDTPAGETPEDVALWGRDNFEQAVTALADSAISLVAHADAPLNTYTDCISGSDAAMRYVGTVSCFIRTLAMNMADTFEQTERKTALIDSGLAEFEPDTASYIYMLYLRDKEDAKALADDYNSHKDAESARLLLSALLDCNDYSIGIESREVSEADTDTSDYRAGILRQVRLIEESLDRFPQWCDNERLREKHGQLTMPRADITTTDLVGVGTSAKVEIAYMYADSIRIRVYKLTGDASFDDDRNYNLYISKTVRPKKIYGNCSVEIPFTEAGRYAIVPSVNGTNDANSSNVVTVTPILPVDLRSGNDHAVITADFVSGTPAKDIAVYHNSRSFNRGKVTSTPLGKTDSHGILRYRSNEEQRTSRWLSFGVDGEELSFDRNISVWYSGSNANTARLCARFMTSRALYHPGDTLQWAVVVSSSDGHSGTTMPGKALTVKLYDANRQEVSATEVTTDALGRAAGAFTVPSGLLTGTFTIRAYCDDAQIGTGNVTVSDFKLPTIMVKNSAVERNEPQSGAVTLRGCVKTYSGMPVVGARVDAVISRAERRWCWFYSEEEVGSVSGTTASDGSYSIEVPATLLTASSGMANFIAAITATDSNAETAATSCNFTTGKPLIIATKELGNVDGAAPTEFTFNAFSPEGDNRVIALHWEIVKTDESGGLVGEAVANGDAVAGSAVRADIDDVPAGLYGVRVTAADTTLADTLVDAGYMTLYNSRRNEVPDTGTPYFVPCTNAQRRQDTATLTIGTTHDEATVYVAVSVDTTLTSVKPYVIRRGFQTIDIALPESGNSEPAIRLIGVRDGKANTERIKVVKAAAPAFTVTAESFRDRLVPSDVETWRLRVSLGDEGVAGAGMIATMYNGALDALCGYSMPSGFGLMSIQSSMTVCTTYRNDITIETYKRDVNNYNNETWTWPEWRFLEKMYSFCIGALVDNLYNNCPRSLYKMASAASPGAEEEALATAESADAVSEAAVEEEVTEEQAIPDGGEIEYRDGEVLQAFFMPYLTSDERGNVEISFTVPNANGTWAMKAFAWTTALCGGKFTGEAVASKPVMVQPNLPRFLRCGDVARLGATVYNNTDTAAVVEATVEIFDPTSGEVLTTKTYSVDVASQGSDVVAVDVETPTAAGVLGYRVRCSNGKFSDGEQDAIPVLAAEGLVVESTEFYLDATSEPYIIELPVEAATTYTLEYTSNPIWTVVKAMRGLEHGSDVSTISLVGSLYSTLAARKIAEACPGVGEAYSQWEAHPEDEALTSMLQRNEELKTLLLAQTPWLRAATTQSERMAQLGRIFDSTAVSKALKKKTTALKQRQAASGGFGWLSSSTEPSVWTTRTVLKTIGLAKALGMTEADDKLQSICAAAFSYVDEELKRDMPDGGSDEEFAMICTLWPEFTPSSFGRQILDTTLDNVARNWRQSSTYGKAIDILLLSGNGRATEATKVYESLRQHGVVRPGQGLCFPTVDDIRCYATIIRAYKAMGASQADMDAMRQWITIQAQSHDDLGAYNPDYVIAAVMLTGSDWTSAPLAFGVLVDGTAIESTAMERATGYTVATLEPQSDTLRVEVRPNGATPSYGAVVSTGMKRQATTASHPGRDVSIEKRFLVKRDGQWVETTTFAHGEQIRVQLIIQAGRDMEYVAITDQRAATLAPTEQLPGYVHSGGLSFYRENGDSDTHLFIGYLPKGTYHVTYDMTANNVGTYTSGIATLQSQYAPELTAHSGGTTITVE